MEYPGPVVVAAAAVVAYGDQILVTAQDAHVSSPSFTQVDYRFKGISTIDMTSQFAGASLPVPALPAGSLVVMQCLLAGAGAMVLRARRAPRGMR